MLLTRATDASFLNEVCNDPTVRPFLHGRGSIDLTAEIANADNVALQGEHGGMLMVQVVKGIFELHTNVLPDGRGPWALEMAHACMDWLFSRTNAIEVYTRVPAGNTAARALTMACGAKLEQKITQDLGGGPMPVEIYSGRLQDWIRVAPGLIERGQSFHNTLHNKYAEMRLDVKHHAEDPWHDRHVGAAVGMFAGGQPIKGLLTFNRWCAMAIAPRMTLISLNPLVVDITDCRLEIQGEHFEVIPPCQQE